MDLQGMGASTENANENTPKTFARGDRPKVTKLPGESRKDYLRRWQANYRAYHGADYNAYRDKLRDKDREKTNAISRKSHHKNKHKESYKLARQKWVSENRESYLAGMKRWRENNKERVAELNRKWMAENKEKFRENQRNYQNNRLATDPAYRLIHLLRSRMAGAMRVKSAKKLDSTINLLGCTPSEFKKHLESQFDSNMSWGNYGDYWEVDHIMPIDSFDILKEEEQFAAFNYKNCRPLECEENKRKSNKIIPELIVSNEATKTRCEQSQILSNQGQLEETKADI